MADSTSPEIAARRSRQDDALSKAVVSIARSGLFLDALAEYASAYERAETLPDEPGALIPIACAAHWAARNLVIAAADYHCAQMIFEAHSALIALDRQEA